MISLLRKVIYALYGKGAEQRRARRAAEELGAQKKAAEMRKAEEAFRHAQWVARHYEERAAKEAAAKQREADELARQARLKAKLLQEAEEREAEERRIANPFELGGRYENRKGPFTVIELSGDTMRIRWDNGEEITDTVASQARICSSMAYERAVTDSPAVSSRDCLRCARCGAPIYVDKATYLDGKPYGPICIQHEIHERAR
jgi:hypothetical protein